MRSGPRAAHTRASGATQSIRSLLTLKALSCADGGNHRRADDLAAGGARWCPQLGLPLLLAPRCNVDAARVHSRRATWTRRARGGDWLLRAIAGDPDDLQIMYGVAGERRLTELELPWLAGYEGSRPVRIGNGASDQRQLDVYGEVVDALYQARRRGLDPSYDVVGAHSQAARVARVRLARARRRDLGGSRAASALHPLESHGVGRLRQGGEDDREVRARGSARPLARRS